MKKFIGLGLICLSVVMLVGCGKTQQNETDKELSGSSVVEEGEGEKANEGENTEEKEVELRLLTDEEVDTIIESDKAKLVEEEEKQGDQDFTVRSLKEMITLNTLMRDNMVTGELPYAVHDKDGNLIPCYTWDVYSKANVQGDYEISLEVDSIGIEKIDKGRLEKSLRENSKALEDLRYNITVLVNGTVIATIVNN